MSRPPQAPTCTAPEGCDKPSKARGLCVNHYGRVIRKERAEGLRLVVNTSGKQDFQALAKATDYRLRLAQVAALARMAILLPDVEPGAVRYTTGDLHRLILAAAEGEIPGESSRELLLAALAALDEAEAA